MNKLTRGLSHGAIYAIVICLLILALTPVFNTLLFVALAVAVVLSFSFGIFSNMRAAEVTCGRCSRSFKAVSDSTRCPDCGWSRKDGAQT